MIYDENFVKQLSSPFEVKSQLAVTISSTEDCNPVNDFRKNALVLTITLTCLSVIILLIFACACACRKYRRLQNQYYERLSLIKGGGPNDQNNHSQDSGSMSDRKKPKGAKKEERKIVYKMEEEDE